MADFKPRRSKHTSTFTQNTTQTRKQWIIENVVSLGLALLIVFMVRSSIVEAFKIPSGSMIPTLYIGDHIFVNKFAYGFKVPFTDKFLKEPLYLARREPPKRGDVIVFIFPKDESIHYIKRIIGIPGDKIELRNNTLYLNDHPVDRELVVGSESEKLLHSLDDPKYSATNLDIYKEKLDSSLHFIMHDKMTNLSESHKSFLVPEGQYFVMGDNRDSSNDSRFWGTVPMKNIEGKAFVVWLSFWVSFSDSQFIFRPGRMGNIIH